MREFDVVRVTEQAQIVLRAVVHALHKVYIYGDMSIAAPWGRQLSWTWHVKNVLSYWMLEPNMPGLSWYDFMYVWPWLYVHLSMLRYDDIPMFATSC